MLAEIAFDWEHMSWCFQIDPLHLPVVFFLGFCFCVLCGSPSGQPGILELVSYYISTGSLGSKILPCTKRQVTILFFMPFLKFVR